MDWLEKILQTGLSDNGFGMMYFLFSGPAIVLCIGLVVSVVYLLFDIKNADKLMKQFLKKILSSD